MYFYTYFQFLISVNKKWFVKFYSKIFIVNNIFYFLFSYQFSVFKYHNRSIYSKFFFICSIKIEYSIYSCKIFTFIEFKIFWFKRVCSNKFLTFVTQ